jgi:hypothetical protein
VCLSVDEKGSSSINLPASIPTTNEFPSAPLKNNEKESPTSNGTVPVNLLDFYDGGQLFHYKEYIYMPAAAAAATGTATAASEK